MNTEAERARTTIALAPTLTVTPSRSGTALTPGPTGGVVVLHAVDADGSLVLVPPGAGPAALAGPVVVGAALTAPVPGPDRRLDPVRLAGTARPDPSSAARAVLVAAHLGKPGALVIGPDVVRVEVSEIELDGRPVDPLAYARAACDPIAAESDAAVAHLLDQYPEWVVHCTMLLPAAVDDDAWEIAPVRVDRHGLTLRITTAARDVRHTRLTFPTPLADTAELPAAMRALGHAAARARLRPRA